ncbi:hypothetical protein QTP88_012131 [Uroleucon formosanum]
MPFGWSPSSNTTSTGTNRAYISTSSIGGNVGVFGEWSAAGQRDGIAYRPCVPLLVTDGNVYKDDRLD